MQILVNFGFEYTMQIISHFEGPNQYYKITPSNPGICTHYVVDFKI